MKVKRWINYDPCLRGFIDWCALTHQGGSLKVIMSAVVIPVGEQDRVCCEHLEEHSTAWRQLGTEGIELSEAVTFELGPEGCVRVFQKGEIYPGTCYVLQSKEVAINGQMIFRDSVNFNLAIMDNQALLVYVSLFKFDCL